MNEQLETAEQISAEQLKSAMDGLIERIGHPMNKWSVRAEYIKPMYMDPRAESRVGKIESRPFGTVTRHKREDGNQYYSYGSVIPHNGGSEEELIFKNGSIFVKVDAWEQIGEDNQERTQKEEELSPAEVSELYREITNPTLEDRGTTINAYYQKRHNSRSKIGRFVARKRGTDKPSYF